MTRQTETKTETETKGERVAKRIARAGVCSRREAERLIAQGCVTVNGCKLATPAFLVHPGDTVTVNGKALAQEQPPRLWRLFKKRGLVTTHKDEQGRETVFEKLPKGLPRVISVGRLDLNSEGLLLLTNDGALARFLELPATGWARRYRVRIYGHPTQAQLDKLQNGITVNGIDYGAITAQIDRQQGDNAWVTMTLREGKNREIRRVMDHFGWPVTRLLRLAYGPFQLGRLKPGQMEEIKGKVLKEQCRSFFNP